MDASDEVLLWALDEWNKGNRIKASKLKRIAIIMNTKHNKYMTYGSIDNNYD